MSNVLVISTTPRAGDVLRRGIGGEIDHLLVVVPAVEQSRLQWLANDDGDAREEASSTAEEIGGAIPSDSTHVVVGDSDPLLAAQDALRQFDADEIVVVTRPDEQATWLEQDSAEEISEKLGGLPLRRLTLPD